MRVVSLCGPALRWTLCNIAYGRTPAIGFLASVSPWSLYFRHDRTISRVLPWNRLSVLAWRRRFALPFSHSAIEKKDIMGDERLLASLDLMRRMPPSRMENSLEGACDRCCVKAAAPISSEKSPAFAQILHSASVLCALFSLTSLRVRCSCVWLSWTPRRARRSGARSHRRASQHSRPAIAGCQGRAKEHLPAV